jgi:hypothetical protein
MTDDSTLGGYLELHQRPPAFEGSDGRAYSVAIYVDDAAGADGRFGASLLFVRWTEQGEHPEGHVETDYLAYGASPKEAEAALRALSLWDVKARLDQAIQRRREMPEW